MTKVLIPKERGSGESRVAATPETVKKFVGSGLEVWVEAGAGATSFITDDEYRQAGANVSDDSKELWSGAGLVLKVGPPVDNESLAGPEAAALDPEAVLVALMEPDRNLDAVRTLVERKITCLAMEMVPRITRAQSMDALSSQANIAGYRAVVIAATRSARYFPLLMTAAGTIKPSKVVIIGAGVAGLQAIATAKRLGAVVEVSDIRPEVQEQVESLGGRFIDLPMQESGAGDGGYAKEMGEDFLRKQREILKQHISEANIVITTAAVPGRPAPKLVGTDMVEVMKPGSVIVDLASERGGNCELTQPGEEVVHNGVLILGPLNVAGDMPLDASRLYARNIMALLEPFIEEGNLTLDFEDEVVVGSLLTHAGEVRHQPTADKLQEVPS